LRCALSETSSRWLPPPRTRSTPSVALVDGAIGTVQSTLSAVEPPSPRTRVSEAPT
jgi:hypothetical protein